MIGRNNSVKIEKRIKPIVVLVGGLAGCILNVVGLFNGYWLFEPTRNSIILYGLGLGPIGLVISWLDNLQLKMRYASFYFNWSDGKLSEAYRYEGKLKNESGLIETLVKTSVEDGFYYAGEIDNPYDSVMQVYLREMKKGQEAVILVETEVLTMDLLLEHRYLFAAFMERLTGKADFLWRKEITTVIRVREMSAPLQLLLSASKIYPTNGIYPPKPNQAVGALVFAYVMGEKRIYANNEKLHEAIDKISPTFKNYIVGAGYRKAERVWKGMDWPDILHLKWRDWVFSGALRYHTSYANVDEFIECLVEVLSDDGYEFAGEVENPLGAIMEVFVQEQDHHRQVVFMIEAKTFTMDMFHQHKYYFTQFMNRELNDQEYMKETDIRIIVCVDKMSPSLQTILSVFSVYPEKRDAYICAYVQAERSIYTMAPENDRFFHKHIPWLRRYLPETDQTEPEHVGKGLKWTEIEGLPHGKKEMIVLVHKALNVWKGG